VINMDVAVCADTTGVGNPSGTADKQMRVSLI